MNDAIDIVLTYVTDTDISWQMEYEKYKNIEVNNGIQLISNKQAFGKERSRDWQFLAYWFRAVEKNCPWVRYIWFVCKQESQVPEWLNRQHPKLKIIYHEDFIPQKFLPTFNPMIIKSFFWNIKGLANNFIESSDDMFFIGKIDETMFFENNTPIDDPIVRPYDFVDDNNTAFDKIIINKDTFLHSIYNKNYKYHFHHLPLARNKNFEKVFYNKHKDEIDKSLIISKFRHPKNLIWHMYTDAMKFENLVIIKNIFKNSICCQLEGDNIDTKKLLNKDIIVINDTEFISNFTKLKYTVLKWFNDLLPSQSSFEIFNECKKNLDEITDKYKQINKNTQNNFNNKNIDKKLKNKVVKASNGFTGLPDEWWKSN